MGATAVFVDFGVVGFVAVDEINFGAELLKNFFGDDAGSAVSAIKTDVKWVEIDNTYVIAKVLEIESEGFVMEIFAKAGGNGSVRLRVFERFFFFFSTLFA